MISRAIRDRCDRDDLAHRLGALAANLLRVETFCKRPGSLELARRVMEESKAFVEWSAKNATVEVAAELVQLQSELSLWLRRWPKVAISPTIANEIGPWAARWAARVLAMSGLSEMRADRQARPFSIPDAHKFTVIALGGVWHQIELVETDAGVFTRSAPLAVDDFWAARRGEAWSEAVREADLFLIVTAESSNGDLDREADETLMRCDLMRYGLALASRHFKCGSGCLLSGNRRGGQISVQQTGETPRFFDHPRAKMIQLTEPDFLRAGLFAHELYTPFIANSHRLKSSVESFMDGMQSREAVERVHYFVRSVEGVIRPRKSSTQKDFVDAVQSVLTVDRRKALDEMFRIRSADEHLNDPMEEISAFNDAEREKFLLQRAAEAEAIARTFLRRVLEIPALRERRFPVGPAAPTYWSDEDQQLWGMLLDLDLEVRDMTTHP